MKHRQAELSFSDSMGMDSNRERDAIRSFDDASRLTMDFVTRPEPRRWKIKLHCNECGKNFSANSSLPDCPNCGGVDVELR